jgi:RHS repeat-associated protein
VTREDVASYTVDPDGFVLGQRSPSRLYFLHDGFGSVVATANEGGSESLIARYDPFGDCLANCPTVPYRWLGGLGVYFDDAPIGLYKMGTRYYDPALGRFTQVDPVLGGAANAYDYAGQDPINEFDVDGDVCWGCIKDKAAGAAKGVGKFAWKHKVDIALTGAMFVPVAGQAAALARGGYLTYRTVRTAQVVHRSRAAHTVLKIEYTSARTGGRRFLKLDRPAPPGMPYWHWVRGRVRASGGERGPKQHYRWWGKKIP